jgi:hypothetical protein
VAQTLNVTDFQIESKCKSASREWETTTGVIFVEYGHFYAQKRYSRDKRHPNCNRVFMTGAVIKDGKRVQGKKNRQSLKYSDVLQRCTDAKEGWQKRG